MSTAIRLRRPELLSHRPVVIDIDDPYFSDGELLGDMTYDDVLATGDLSTAASRSKMSGKLFHSITPRELPVIPKGWCITTGVPT